MRILAIVLLLVSCNTERSSLEWRLRYQQYMWKRQYQKEKVQNMKLNKLSVVNSLVNNINAKKKAGTSKPKSKSTVDPKQYAKMKKGWK